MAGTELGVKVANDPAEKTYSNWRTKDLLGHDRQFGLFMMNVLRSH